MTRERLALAALLLGAGALAVAASPGAAVFEPGRVSVLTPAGPEEPAPALLARLKRLVYAEHRIARGEYSISLLAKAYGTTVMSLQATNNNELLYPSPGMKVTVHNKVGQLYEVRKGTESLSRIVARFHRDPRQAAKFREAVVAANRLPGSALLSDYEFPRGKRLLLPNVTVNFDTYRFPFTGGWPRISSRFGSRYHPLLKRRRFHDGLDIAKPWGTPVVPARSGAVVEAGWREGYGMMIVIRHSDGATTRYGHLSKISVKPGDIVTRGKTLIGRVGSTGLSTGPHLHFEVRDRNGRPVNPGAKIGRR